MTQKPIRLLTLLRIAELMHRPIRDIERALADHPDIRPAATADGLPVYDRDALVRLMRVLAQVDDDGRR